MEAYVVIITQTEGPASFIPVVAADKQSAIGVVAQQLVEAGFPDTRIIDVLNHESYRHIGEQFIKAEIELRKRK